MAAVLIIGGILLLWYLFKKPKPHPGQIITKTEAEIRHIGEHFFYRFDGCHCLILSDEFMFYYNLANGKVYTSSVLHEGKGAQVLIRTIHEVGVAITRNEFVNSIPTSSHKQRAFKDTCMQALSRVESPTYSK